MDRGSNLVGRTAVITGGSGGLGSTMARAIGRHGVKVAILNRTQANGRAVASEITKGGGIAIALGCDVLDQESVLQAQQRVLTELGPCDLLINAAGGGNPAATTSKETFDTEDVENDEVTTLFNMPLRAFREAMDLNLLGTWLPVQVFGRQMVGREGATIINISSMAAYRPATRVPAYSSAKAAIENLTKWLAVHLASSGIRVNAIAPDQRQLEFPSDDN